MLAPQEHHSIASSSAVRGEPRIETILREVIADAEDG
jgi:hypothetical protein